MLENIQNDLALNLDDLEGVSGGIGVMRALCPVHKDEPLTRYDSGIYKGKTVIRLKCKVCNRLYNIRQVVDAEDLSIDYTNIKYD